MSKITIDKYNQSITFINNGIGFSQFGVANEILDLIDNQQKRIDKAVEMIDKLGKDISEDEGIFWQIEHCNKIINILKGEEQ